MRHPWNRSGIFLEVKETDLLVDQAPHKAQLGALEPGNRSQDTPKILLVENSTEDIFFLCVFVLVYNRNIPLKGRRTLLGSEIQSFCVRKHSDVF